MEENKKFMRRAIKMSIEGLAKVGVGPFGAVVVRNGEVVSECNNSVVATNDPTAHAEVNAIREACRKLGTFDLSGCELYTSCEPCPMCLSAAYWAHIDVIYYGNTREDAKAIDFDDSFIYDQIPMAPNQRSIPAHQLLRDEAIEAFNIWENSTTKVEY